MYLLFQWLRAVLYRGRVTIHLSSGRRIHYRRPKGMSVINYRTEMASWLSVDRKNQKLGDDKHSVFAISEEILAVEIY